MAVIVAVDYDPTKPRRFRMPATRYRVWAWGQALTDGVEEKYIAGVQTVAKCASSICPFTVANEYICQELGRMVGLPIPVGAILERDDKAYYASLDFNVEGHKLPPADADALARDMPDLALGIVMFDIWVGNGDRHDRNLSYNKNTRKVQLYDHGHSFLYPEGRTSLEARVDSLGIAGHCLAGIIGSFGTLLDWEDRIRSLPRYCIRNAIQDATTVGLPQEDVDYCIDYLVARGSNLLRLIYDNKTVFRSVAPNLFDDVIGKCLESDHDYCI